MHRHSLRPAFRNPVCPSGPNAATACKHSRNGGRTHANVYAAVARVVPSCFPEKQRPPKAVARKAPSPFKAKPLPPQPETSDALAATCLTLRNFANAATVASRLLPLLVLAVASPCRYLSLPLPGPCRCLVLAVACPCCCLSLPLPVLAFGREQGPSGP